MPVKDVNGDDLINGRTYTLVYNYDPRQFQVGIYFDNPPDPVTGVRLLPVNSIYIPSYMIIAKSTFKGVKVPSEQPMYQIAALYHFHPGILPLVMAGGRKHKTRKTKKIRR